MINYLLNFYDGIRNYQPSRFSTCEDFVCLGRIQYIQNQTRESMHWRSFSLQQFFGSEFSEHQKGPFNWEGKTAAFWEFTTMVGIINLTTNRDTLTAAVVQVHFSSKNRHITPHSTWISVGFINFRYPTNKKRSDHFFFRISSQNAFCFFWKTGKKSSIQGFFFRNGKLWVQKGWGKVPLPPSERRGSQEGRRHGSRAEKLRCFTDGFPGPSQQCFRLISHWCWSLDAFFVKRFTP